MSKLDVPEGADLTKMNFANGVQARKWLASKGVTVLDVFSMAGWQGKTRFIILQGGQAHQLDVVCKVSKLNKALMDALIAHLKELPKDEGVRQVLEVDWAAQENGKWPGDPYPTKWRKLKR